jgi:threonine dehydrogenase-like Zn-dependent dehydrogenase
MKTIVYNAPWQVSLEDKPEPKYPGYNEVVVKVRSTGICGTDLGIISGQYHAKPSIVLGHESAGDVVSVGSNVSNFKPGDRVVIDPTYYCGHCRMCRTGRQNHCEHKGHTETGVSSDGTFSNYYITEERFLYKLAEHISYDEASMTEPLSCVLTGINQIQVRPEFRTVVLGGGPMGMLYSYALAARGVSGGIVEISKERALIAADKADSRWQVFSSLDEATEVLASDNGQLDIIVDTTGVMSSLSIQYLSRGGYLLLVGLRDKEAVFNPRDIVDRSLSIVGSIDSLGTFSTAHYMIESGVVPTKKLITHAYPIEEFEMALNQLGCDVKNQKMYPNAKAMKVIIHP